MLDTADDEALEAVDVTPGADTDPPEDSSRPPRPECHTTTDNSHHGGCSTSPARRALAGPKHDRKLAKLTAELKGLLADGYDPIVFCRFIDTAEYVAEHLDGALGKNVDVAAVTGTLPPSRARSPHRTT